MDTIIIVETNKTLISVPAETFPEGVLAAHQRLRSLVPLNPLRQYYGISYGDGKDHIVYMATAGELTDGEAISLGLQTFLLRKGRYLCRTLPDFMNHLPQIGINFREMFLHPEMDRINGYCVEEYINEKDLNCWVKLLD